MRGTLLITAALLAAAPVDAQVFVWNADRPDGTSPMGIAADRTLARGSVRTGYRFMRMKAQGLKSGPDPLADLDALDLGFSFVPIRRTVDVHLVSVGIGVTDDLTLRAAGGWTSKQSEFANEEVFFDTEASGITDVEADILWQLYGFGLWRGHVQLGIVAPVGSVDQRADFPEDSDAQLPYDMQIGSGVWTLVPAFGAQVMNELGSVGLQIRGSFPLASNDRGWRPGQQVDGVLWMARRFNDFVSASVGLRGSVSKGIQGIDAELETLRVPDDLALSFGGNRIDFPVGINIRLPSGPLAGQRFGAEVVWTAHEDTHGPRIASDWTVSLGWQGIFSLTGP